MTEFWVCALALTIFLYVTLDGFDLGVGMLFALDRDDTTRRQMMAAIAPVWDGNETWLVLNATILFGVFPLTYATLMSAFYLPVFVMLAALVLRGVAFEFRVRSRRSRWLWDLGFGGGSFVAAFMQGMTVGALVEGLPFDGQRYVGGTFGWFSPYALLCGAGLCVGYMALGAGWLRRKTAEDVQRRAFRLLPWLFGATVLFFVTAGATAVALEARLLTRWAAHPALLAVPPLGIALCVLMADAIRRGRELTPFLCVLALFAVAFVTLAAGFYPYMIPFAITVADAAAPHSSIAFLFWGAGVVVLPVTLLYSLVIYVTFKGKVLLEEDSY